MSGAGNNRPFDMRQFRVGVPSDPKKGKELLWTLPAHLFVPRGAYSVDLDNIQTVNAAASATLLSFKCPADQYAYFTQWSLMTQDPIATTAAALAIRFQIRVNGTPVVPFQGVGNGIWPVSDRILWTRFNIDFKNDSLRMINLHLKPQDLLEVSVTNGDVAAHDIGVRLVGLISPFNEETDPRY